MLDLESKFHCLLFLVADFEMGEVLVEFVREQLMKMVVRHY